MSKSSKKKYSEVANASQPMKTLFDNNQNASSPKKRSIAVILLWICNAVLFIAVAFGAYKGKGYLKQISDLQNELQNIQQQQRDMQNIQFSLQEVQSNLQKQQADFEQQHTSVKEKMEQVQPVYIFDLERVVAASDLVTIQKEYEEQVIKLGKEVETAKTKIKGLKKSKVNEDFSDVYYKSLVLKRDELIENHQKEMIEITNNINQALAEVAEEKSAPAVFNIRAVAVTTKHVVDISDDVISKINTLLKDRKSNKTEKASEEKAEEKTEVKAEEKTEVKTSKKTK